jgi:hypothetical protein
MQELVLPLKPYLFSVRLADGELTSSYVARLATVNCLQPKEVLDQITTETGSRTGDAQRFPYRRLDLNRLALARLAQLSGHTERALQLALTLTLLPGTSWNRPVARLRRQPRHRARAWAAVTGCPRCERDSLVGRRPIVEFRDDRVYCRSHWLWLADQHDSPPFPIDVHPELRGAVTLLRRTYRRYGLKTYRAFNVAHSIWATHQPGNSRVEFIRGRWATRADRMNLRAGATTLAPRYPDIAALPAMIASPRWKTAAGHRRRQPNDTRPDITNFLTAHRLGHPDPGTFAAHPGAIGQWSLTLRNFHPERDRLELEGPSTSTCTSAGEP